MRVTRDSKPSGALSLSLNDLENYNRAANPVTSRSVIFERLTCVTTQDSLQNKTRLADQYRSVIELPTKQGNFLQTDAKSRVSARVFFPRRKAFLKTLQLSLGNEACMIPKPTGSYSECGCPKIQWLINIFSITPSYIGGVSGVIIPQFGQIQVEMPKRRSGQC